MEKIETKKNLIESFFTYSELNQYLTWDTLIYVIVSLLFIFIAKWNYNKFQPNYNLDNELLEKDNKALAVSFMGYILGLGIIITNTLSSQTSGYFLNIFPPFLAGLVDLIIWFLIGILLLNLSRVINNRFILRGFSNEKEIIEDKNIGTGIVQLGGYISSALIISALIGQDGENSILQDLINVIFYFILTQFLLIIYSFLYRQMNSYNLLSEIEKDNEAVGITFGLHLVAIGLILTFPIHQDGNFLLFLFWFINGVVLLTLSRWFLDKVIFHKSNLDQEFTRDNNWGIALIEGTLVIIIAFIINSSFL